MCEQPKVRAVIERRSTCVQCSAPPTADSPWCSEHLADAVEREQARLRKARERERRRVERRCRDCGKPSEFRRCPACHRKKKRGVTRGVTPIQPIRDLTGADRRARIAARTTRTFEKSGDPSNWGFRTRSHGRHRGHPSRQEEDSWDLRAAEAEFRHAEASLATFYSAEVQALPRIQRDAMLAEAVGHMELAERFLTELIDRSRRRLR